MVAQRAGKIINIASQVAAIVRETPHAPYYASKSGVLNLTRALAAEWGRAGVYVNAIAPGVFYPTRISRPTLGAQPGRLEAAAHRTMLGRVGNAAEDLKGSRRVSRLGGVGLRHRPHSVRGRRLDRLVGGPA